ncbi:MAG TPA: asparagine synthase C-terminal domain-containing protein [Pseudolabrys sp.]|nr:asparagine synthase C-terminal domain-containing protein [Pseudolabrys sp.]
MRIEPTRTDVHAYWAPDLKARRDHACEEDYVQEARARFDRAVVRTLRDTPRAALLVSGGLDSSAIAATAARLGYGGECYTAVAEENSSFMGDENWYADERPKAEALARLYPQLRFRFIAPETGNGIREAAPRWFLDFALPNCNAADMNWFYELRRAFMADGHRVAISGTMGNFSLSWDGHFSLPALARAGRIGTMLKEARAIGRQNGLPLAHVLRSDLVVRAAPRPVQRLLTRLRGRDPDDSGLTLLRREALERLGLRERWRDNGFDPRYRLFGSGAAFRAHQLFDQLQATRDIGAMSAGMTGLERRDPYADRELIEFCLAVPEWLYRQGGVRRAFARAVFADRLPPEILRETKRGAQAANWFATLQSRKIEIAEEAERIEASPLASGLIDVPRLKALIAAWPTDEREARARSKDYRLALARAVHVSQFIRWVEGGNG